MATAGRGPIEASDEESTVRAEGTLIPRPVFFDSKPALGFTIGDAAPQVPRPFF